MKPILSFKNQGYIRIDASALKISTFLVGVFGAVIALLQIIFSSNNNFTLLYFFFLFYLIIFFFALISRLVKKFLFDDKLVISIEIFSTYILISYLSEEILLNEWRIYFTKLKRIRVGKKQIRFVSKENTLIYKSKMTLADDVFEKLKADKVLGEKTERI